MLFVSKTVARIGTILLTSTMKSNHISTYKGKHWPIVQESWLISIHREGTPYITQQINMFSTCSLYN